MKKILTIILLLPLIASAQFTLKDTAWGAGGTWNSKMVFPSDHDSPGNTKKYQCFVFFMGSGEVNRPSSVCDDYGPILWYNGPGNGTITVGNGTHQVIWITISQVANGSGFTLNGEAKPIFDKIKARFRIKDSSFHVMGWSAGGNLAKLHVTEDVQDNTPPYGPFFYADQIKTVIDFQGVVPDDNGSNWQDLVKNFANNRPGGRYIGIWGTADGSRGIPEFRAAMNVAKAGSATEIITGDAHNQTAVGHTFGNATTNPDKYTINGIFQTVYEAAFRYGDTTLPYTGNQPPTVDPGADQTMSIPASSTTLTAIGSDIDGTIGSYYWTKIIVPSQTNRRIGVIGSSTSANSGYAGVSSGAVYVNRLKEYYKSLLIIDTIYNLATVGTTIYEGMPTGYTPPGGRPSPNTSINITAILAKNPDVVLINYPTNGYDVYTVTEVMAAFRRLAEECVTAGKPYFITTTQPRSGFGPSEELKLKEIKDSIVVEFPNNYINFWDGMVEVGTTNVLPEYDNADGVHFNELGQERLFQKVLERNPISKTITSAAVITSPNSASTTITGLTLGVHYFQVGVVDNIGLAASAIISVKVDAAGFLNANAGPDLQLYMPLNTAVLNGSSSTGTALTYAWSKISGPTEGRFYNYTTSIATDSNLAVGTYLFQLKITSSGIDDYDTVQVVVNQQRSPACNNAAKVRYTLPTTDGGTGINCPNLTTITNPIYPIIFPNLKGGDTLIIPHGLNGTYTNGIILGGFSGDSCNPIVIIDSARITVQTGYIRIYSGRFFKLVHSGYVNGKAGIHFEGSSSGPAVAITSQSSDVLVDGLTFHDVENGVQMRTSVDTFFAITYSPNWEFRKCEFRNLKIVKTGGEGMYMGHTLTPDPCEPLGGDKTPIGYKGLWIHHVVVDSAGWDGIQTSIGDSIVIEHCRVTNFGLNDFGDQKIGIILGGYSQGRVNNDTVRLGSGVGIASFGYGQSKIYYNAIDSVGFGGLFQGEIDPAIYISDNEVPCIPFPAPLSITVLGNCIQHVSSYGSGAAIVNSNNFGNTIPGTISGNIILDPLGRTLANLIVSNASDVISGNTLGICATDWPPIPPIPPYFGPTIRIVIIIKNN